MQAMFDWLAGLPPFALYGALALAAAVENFFPPFPADTVVAFGSFLAARGQGSVVGSFLATWLGNIAGAMGVYALGRRYGAERLANRFGGAGAQGRVRALYGRYGVWALGLSRFLPGVRAIVPPVAGALGVGAVRSAVAMAVPSGIWYAGITYLAFTAGGNFDALRARMAAGQRWLAIGAAVVAALGLAAWWLGRRRRAGRTA